MADTEIPMGEPPAKGNQTSGPPRIVGAIIPDRKNLAAHLRSGKILAYAVFGALVVLGGGWFAIDKLSSLGPSKNAEQKIQLHQAPILHVPTKQQANIAAPVTSRADSATAATASAARTSTPQTSVPQTTPAPVPAKPSAQVAAFDQALSGQGGSGNAVISWGGNQSSPQDAQLPSAVPSQGANPLPGASPLQGANPYTLEKSIEEMTGKEKQQHGVYDTHLVRREVSPYELLQGSVIPAILTTGIKSDIAGQVTAVVTHPVYNSLNAAYVLIPAGSRLVGTYQNGASMGQTRLAVMWTRIEFPNGTTIRLGSMTGASPRGYAGFKDLVNNHTWEIFKNALLLSLIDVGMAVASPTSTTTNTTGVTGNQALQDSEQALAQTFGEAEAQLFQKEINVSPTLTIRPGYAFNVIVAKDLVFPGPYTPGVTQVGTVTQGEPAAPSEKDPYLETNP